MAEAPGGAHLVGECVALGGGELVTHRRRPPLVGVGWLSWARGDSRTGGWKGVRERRSGVGETFQSSGYLE